MLGASKLGVNPAECLVFEDAPAGIEAGKAAGMKVIGVPTTYTWDRLTAADAVAKGLEHVTVRVIVRPDNAIPTLEVTVSEEA